MNHSSDSKELLNAKGQNWVWRNANLQELQVSAHLKCMILPSWLGLKHNPMEKFGSDGSARIIEVITKSDNICFLSDQVYLSVAQRPVTIKNSKQKQMKFRWSRSYEKIEQLSGLAVGPVTVLGRIFLMYARNREGSFKICMVSSKI